MKILDDHVFLQKTPRNTDRYIDSIVIILLDIIVKSKGMSIQIPLITAQGVQMRAVNDGVSQG